MSAKDENSIEILNKIYSGNFTANDIGMLFMWLRPYTGSKGTNLLSDISCFVAHSEGRTQGISYDYIHSFVDQLIRVSESGGTITPKIFFSKQKVIEQLINICSNNLSTKVFHNKIRKQANKIIECLMTIMDNIDFKFADPRVIRCNLKKEKDKIYFQLHLRLSGPVITVTEGGVIQIALFD